MTTIYDFKVKDIKNKEWDLADLKGKVTKLKGDICNARWITPFAKVVLFVNVASKCGFTKQYAGLEELYKKYEPKGFVIVGSPCNQFGGQGKFCHWTYPA